MVGSKEKFLRSGDLGFFEDNKIFICGRIKDLIIVNGANYYPQDIEAAVENSSPAVRPGCVTAFTSSGMSDAIEVVFEIRSNCLKDIDSVVSSVQRAVAQSIGSIPSRVVAIKEKTIPKTTSGKIQRRATRNALNAGAFPIVADASFGSSDKQACSKELCDEVGANIDALGCSTTEAAETVMKPDTFESDMDMKAIAELQILLGFQLDPSAFDMTLPELGLSSLQIVEFAQKVKNHLVLMEYDVVVRTPLRDLLKSSSLSPSVSEAVKWDLRSTYPVLFSFLCKQQPLMLKTIEELSAEIPVPPTNGTFDDGRYFRPEGQFRAFYSHGDGSFVVAIKGAEVHCSDQLGFLQVLQQKPFERFEVNSIASTLEYFLIQERKIPGALILPEALSEAEKAAELQRAFLERFGEFGNFPVPLLIRHWSRNEVARFDARLRSLVSGSLHDIIDSELECGLACYVYYHPVKMAERVSHYANRLSSESWRTGHAGMRNTKYIHTTLKNDLDPGSIIASWIDCELLARCWCFMMERVVRACLLLLLVSESLALQPCACTYFRIILIRVLIA